MSKNNISHYTRLLQQRKITPNENMTLIKISWITEIVSLHFTEPE